MNPELLETLVKLAAAGTSGVCVLCVAATGLTMWKLPNDASPRRIQALKHYMNTCLGIALISAGTTGLAGYWDYQTKQALRQDKRQLEGINAEQAQEIAAAERKAIDLQQIAQAAQNELQSERVRWQSDKQDLELQIAKARMDSEESRYKATSSLKIIGEPIPANSKPVSETIEKTSPETQSKP